MGLVSGHVDALDLQAELCRFWSSPGGRGVMEGSARIIEQEQFAGAGGLTGERMRRTPEIEASKLRSADCYWVSPDMTALTAHAAASMRAETLEDTDLPGPSGFVLVAEPVTGLFYSGPEAATALQVPDDPPFLAFSWGLSDGVVQVTAYTDTAVVAPRAIHVWPRVMVLNQHDWGLGESAPDDEYAAAHRFIKAFWALCQQRIGKAETVAVDRGARRRAQRSGVELTGVQVVDLRRRQPTGADSDAAGTVDWSCRWIVGGHWRQQWHPSLGQHRQTWIAPYEKGPEGAPLKVKDRVYRVIQ